jgi:TadE-like protein
VRIDNRDRGIRRADSRLRPRFARARRDREGGQALVEFVLALFPLIIIVGGAIQLSSGVNNWHDLNRIANEGARWAAVDSWPDCAQSPAVCHGDATCDDTLVNMVRCEARNAGIEPSAVSVVVCQPRPAGAPPPTKSVWEPISVRLSVDHNILSASEVSTNGKQRLGNSGFLGWFTITIRGEATMRLETTPTRTNPGVCA